MTKCPLQSWQDPVSRHAAANQRWTKVLLREISKSLKCHPGHTCFFCEKYYTAAFFHWIVWHKESKDKSSDITFDFISANEAENDYQIVSLTKGLNIGVCLNSCCPALAEPCCKGWALRACQQISASLPSAPGASQSRDGKVSEQGRGEGGGSWGAEQEERFCVHLLQGHEVIFPFFLSLDTTRTRTHIC